MKKVATKPPHERPRMRVTDHIFAPLSVGRISHYGMAYMRHVNANLMRASGLYLHFEQGKLVIGFGDFEKGMGRAPGSPAEHRHAGPVVRAATYAGFDLSPPLRHSTIDERDIHLEDEAVSELVRQLLVRQVILRND